MKSVLIPAKLKFYYSDLRGKQSLNTSILELMGERIKTSTTVKYLGVLLYEHLNWQPHINALVTKLGRAPGILSKIRFYVPKISIRNNLFFSLQFPHNISGGENKGKKKKISELQDKAIGIINFLPKNYPVAELYKHSRILKLSDYIKLLNCMFVRDTLTATQIPAFKNYF